MSKKVIIYVVLVFFALSMNVVFSGMEYPQELKKEIAPYPKAKIVQTMNVSGAVMVVMEVGDNPDSIFEFYKKELMANGWTILAEVKQQGNSSLMGEKGSNNVVVNIGSGHPGKSMVSLTLAPKQ